MTASIRIVFCLLFGLACIVFAIPSFGQDAEQLWMSLMDGMRKELLEHGDPKRALPLAERAENLAEQAFGPDDQHTLISKTNLAEVLEALGRYKDSEPLFRYVLRYRQEHLGPDAPQTLQSMNNLGSLLEAAGNYPEAENLFLKALAGRTMVLGKDDPATITSMNNLGALYQDEGRYDEAASLVQSALQILLNGPRSADPQTFLEMNNLGVILWRQWRPDEAEKYYNTALDGLIKMAGKEHPYTWIVIGNLGLLLENQGRLKEAEPLIRAVYDRNLEMLGFSNAATLLSANNLALVLEREGKIGDAEKLYRKAINIGSVVQGPGHPDTILARWNLATLLGNKGRTAQARSKFSEAFKLSRDNLGAAHPMTLQIQFQMASFDEAHGNQAAAVQSLRDMEPQLLTWVGTEYYNADSVFRRQQLVSYQENYQDIALTFALLHNSSSPAIELAASAVLHFKELAEEEEAFLAQLSRHGLDSRVRDLAVDVSAAHNRLARVFHAGGGHEELNKFSAELDAKELELGRVSRDYAQTLQVRSAKLQDVRAKLPSGSGLLEIRQYWSADLKSRKEARWAGILISPTEPIRIRDLGTEAAAMPAVEALLSKESSGDPGSAAAHALYGQLIMPFAKEVAKLDRLYVAPDGILYLVPFGALLTPDGHRLIEAKDVRLIQTGRDLLRAVPEQQGRGLVAMGGIDFGRAPVESVQTPVIPSTTQQTETTLPPAEAALTAQGAAAAANAPGSDGLVEHLRRATADSLRGGFGPLRYSREEVEGIALLYEVAHPDEPPPSVITGASATKARLISLGQPPRVLHLATHGFYRPAKYPADRPLLLSGIALAGANQSLQGAGPDGMLFAIEALDLNLHGTQLVVLSACETAQGQIDYGEGISGMVRALRIAGARNVLVALRPVDDEGAADFMQLFYHHWVSQEHDDPAAALRDTQRDYLKPNSPLSKDPTWSNFILVGD
jgi:CHAT domain-containing protein/tetratricopeptide (TPR) repeat protein